MVQIEIDDDFAKDIESDEEYAWAFFIMFNRINFFNRI